MGGQCLAIFRPFKKPAASALNKSLEKTSEPRMKRKGESGSPYLKPLDGEKNP